MWSGEIFHSDSRCFLSNIIREVQRHLFKANLYLTLKLMSYVNIYNVIHFIGSFLLQRLCIRPLLQAQVHWKEQVPDPGDGF